MPTHRDASTRSGSSAWARSTLTPGFSDANEVLKQSAARGSSGHHDGWMRQGLVVSEVALALMLLVGAGLLSRAR